MSTTALSFEAVLPQGIVTHDTKYHRIGNRIFIDKGLFLARKPNSINTDWRCRSNPIGELINEHVSELQQYLGLKRFSEKKYRPIVDCLLANLRSAASQDGQLIYSRNTGSNRTAGKAFLQVVDYLADCGLVDSVVGRANEYTGNSSWLSPTGKLFRQLEENRVRVQLAKDAAMIELRGSDKKPVKIPTGKKTVRLQVKRLSTPVRAFNTLWLDHVATLGGHELVPFVRRIFNHSLKLGGRYYGGGFQNISKADRALIEIDGEPTIEPDFDAIHFVILYAWAGRQYDLRCGDPYTVPGFERTTVKRAMLSLLNSENASGWCANVTRSGNPQVKQAINDYRSEYLRFIAAGTQGLKTGQPKKPCYADSFISGMPDGIQGKELLQAIKARHRPIAHLFGSLNIGLRLQFTDSQIMSRVIEKLCRLNIPVLPIHDSIRCRKGDGWQVQTNMKEAFKEITGFEGFVS